MQRHRKRPTAQSDTSEIDLPKPCPAKGSPIMPSEIEGKVYYSLIEAARLMGVPMETLLGWLTGRTPLNGFTLEAVRDAQRNQYFLSADSVRILQHKNEFITPGAPRK
jgi:hypothetical protein